MNERHGKQSALDLSTYVSNDCAAFLLSIDAHHSDSPEHIIIYGEIDHVYV
jgi:hypothetical protein